ncbi:PhnD/SsuA/transferrin family substrate-binding protein [Acetobacteraceae bacterium KSS8]|uniref:PhnD/SsuA/transferrin family substrate-binding protein n=1 Tax=Endosaccharibacter trunci TaxID=2812733 RepID=A0ABT1W420_9PROT|nr:PhnD/SsuA/transferrin family substrate-binding protein [Acetobacteraceae bacterium KSS8]
MVSRLSASLPMYDLRELRAVTDAFWTAIAARLPKGLRAPVRRARPEDLEAHWRDPALLLSQTCGLPLLGLRPGVRVVATPAYRAEGCQDGYYRSALVVRRDDPARSLADLRGRRAAINDWTSNSGMNLLRASVAPWAREGRFFGAVSVSGSHVASMAAVTADEADVAAIDAVTLALVRRVRPGAFAGLRVLGWTMDAPGLPLISAQDEATCRHLQSALRATETDGALRPVLDALLIDRFTVLPGDAYARISVLERRAEEAGYPVLR